MTRRVYHLHSACLTSVDSKLIPSFIVQRINSLRQINYLTSEGNGAKATLECPPWRRRYLQVQLHVTDNLQRRICN